MRKYTKIEGRLNGDRLDGYIAELDTDDRYLLIKIPFCSNKSAEEELQLCANDHEISRRH